MKKFLALAIVAVALTGCGGFVEKFGPDLTAKDFDVICLGGVKYYYRRALGSSSGFMAVVYKTDGTIGTCK